MNLRPSGYEPDELPGCSTPRLSDDRRQRTDWVVPLGLSLASGLRIGFVGLTEFCLQSPVFWFGWPGDDLLSHALRRSTIGAEGFHGRVRDGIGCFPLAIATRPSKPDDRDQRSGIRGAVPLMSDRGYLVLSRFGLRFGFWRCTRAEARRFGQGGTDP